MLPEVAYAHPPQKPVQFSAGLESLLIDDFSLLLYTKSTPIIHTHGFEFHDAESRPVNEKSLQRVDDELYA